MAHHSNGSMYLHVAGVEKRNYLGTLEFTPLGHYLGVPTIKVRCNHQIVEFLYMHQRETMCNDDLSTVKLWSGTRIILQ